MRPRLSIGAIGLAIVLGACKSQPSTATTDAVGNAQLSMVNASTNEADGKGDERQAIGVHTVGQHMAANPQPPKTQ